MDREKVIKTLNDALTAKENYPWARAEMSFDFIRMLIAMLKEQEAVIHCKDCKWFTAEEPGYTTGLCMLHDGFNYKPDYFCADGKMAVK